MSLRWRLTAVIGGVVALMLFTASFLAYISAEGELNQQVNEFLLTRSRETEAGLDTGLPSNIPAGLTEEALGFQRGTLNALTRADSSIQLLLEDGMQAYVISEPSLPVTVADQDIARRKTTGGAIVRTTFDRFNPADGRTYRVLVSSNSRGALMVGRSIDDVTQTMNGLRGWLIMISTLGSFGAALVGWLVADRVLQPVTRLAAATNQVAETQRFDADIPVEGADELGALARSFNSMLSTLRASREQQERLVRDANHELRTPLTSIRTNIDVLRRRGADLGEDEHRSIIVEMDSEVRELTELVSELVGFATNSASLTPDAFVDVDLVSLCTAVVERTIRRTGRYVTVSGASQALVSGDAAGLERAIGNLVGNAVKFSPGERPIEVVVAENGVEVRDRGPGIDEGDLELIFDRFYRADATRTLPGSGLGLAIVSDIARAHGGDTYAANHPGGGAIVGFTIDPDLPRLSAQQRESS